MTPTHHEITHEWNLVVRGHNLPAYLPLVAADTIARHNGRFKPSAKCAFTDDEIVAMNTELRELAKQKAHVAGLGEKGGKELRVLEWREEVLVALLGERKDV